MLAGQVHVTFPLGDYSSMHNLQSFIPIGDNYGGYIIPCLSRLYYIPVLLKGLQMFKIMLSIRGRQSDGPIYGYLYFPCSSIVISLQ